ncbi:hypothetical protein L1049_019964 [Liquidambar formosana]|uniref:Uncharacterized protein n=1 Tax=Liquidambar formosana TaxID=63359 RepID=A0AAP0S795_LIQFO
MNLMCLEYDGYEIQNFIFRDVPQLVKMYVNFVDLEGGIPYVFTQLAKDLPHLERVKRLLPSITVFSNLKFLDVIMVLFKEEYDLLWITSILNGCPLLQKLHLMMVIKPSVRVYCGSDRWENFDPVVPWTDCQWAMLLQMLQVEVRSNAKLLIL